MLVERVEMLVMSLEEFTELKRCLKCVAVDGDVRVSAALKPSLPRYLCSPTSSTGDSETVSMSMVRPITIARMLGGRPEFMQCIL